MKVRRGNWRSSSGQVVQPVSTIPVPQLQISTKEKTSVQLPMKVEDNGDFKAGISPLVPKETTEVTGVKKRKPWQKIGADGKIQKRKKNPKMRHIRIRKIAKPKNAVNCLNELAKGVQYKFENCTSGGSLSYCCTVQVDGGEYKGYGTSQDMAKQAAAEAALLNCFTKSEDADSENVPWAAVTSFALYKLFSSWKEGKVGANMEPLAHGPVKMTLPVITSEAPNSAEILANFNEKLGKKVPKPAKVLPSNAATMHPVNLLHIMVPAIEFETVHTQEDKTSYFTMTAKVGEQTFVGTGQSQKKAKFNLAKEAVQAVFGVESQYASPY